jgi:hypothetical protein
MAKRDRGFWIEYHGGPRDGEMEEMFFNPPLPDGVAPHAMTVTREVKIFGREVSPGVLKPESVTGTNEGIYRRTGWADEELQIARFDWTHDIPGELREFDEEI